MYTKDRVKWHRGGLRRRRVPDTARDSHVRATLPAMRRGVKGHGCLLRRRSLAGLKGQRPELRCALRARIPAAVVRRGARARRQKLLLHVSLAIAAVVRLRERPGCVLRAGRGEVRVHRGRALGAFGRAKASSSAASQGGLCRRR